ncbi:PAS domain S-box protein [Chloroflexales bacterium ZM16-3]|nr:PAS domain S-box protein [Chloroflexales bacterium ZM16-3]
MGNSADESTTPYPEDAAAIRRRRAETLISAEDEAPALSQSPEEMLHELQVHQIELELQNEELRRAQQDLESTRARYFDLYDLAPVGYITLNAQGMIQEANLTAATMLKVPRSALLSQPLGQFVAPVDQDSYYLYRRALIREGGPQVCELRMLQLDHAPFWARLEATVAPGVAGKAAMYRVVIIDITLRVESEAAVRELNATLERRVAERTGELGQTFTDLRTSEERLRMIMQTTLDGFWSVDLQLRFIDVNEAYCAMSGYSRDEILTMRIPDVEANEHSEETESRVRKIIATGADRFETRHRRKDGSCFDVEISVAHIASGDGEMVCFCRDVTARKRAEQALERQIAVQAAVAHCSQILLQPASTPADQQLQLTDALSAVSALLDVGQAIIIENFSDPEDGLCARMIAGVHTANGPFAPSHPASLKTPWHYAPAAMRAALEAGTPWGGPVVEALGDFPPLLKVSHSYGIRSLQICPIFVEGSWWGGLVFTETARTQVWSQAEILLLQMSAELIGTAIQRWQAEADLSLQLRYAEVLASCSQALLHDECDTERQRVLETVLTMLRETVCVSRIYIYQPPNDKQGEASLRLLADSQAPGLSPYIEPSSEEIMDAPQAMLEALYAGHSFGGPVPGHFPDNPHFQRSLDQNGVQSLLMVPVILRGSLWGILTATDRVQQRNWDAPTVQLLRTAAEMIATFQQRWHATQALREREHFIQRVTKVSPDIIHVLDLATQQSIFVNRPLATQFGYPPEEITEISLEVIQRLTHPDDYERVIAHYESLHEAADGQVAEQAYRIRNGDGSERWLLSRDLVFSHDKAGQPSQILSIIQDITASKRTEQALAASEARLRALRDALPDILFIVHVDGTFLESHTPRQTEVLAPPEKFLGRKISEVLPPSISTLAYDAIARVRESGGLELFEYDLTFSERNLMFEARIVPIIGDELLFVVRDITERRRTTEALLQAKETAEAADRAKSTFLAHISHEIRTPLTAIIGMTSLLHDTNLSPRQRESVTTIQTGAETLLNIIGNILDFSKIEASQMDLTVQPFDLRDCLNGTRDLVAHQARLKGLSLRWEVDPTVPATLAGDQGRLRQILVNLLINAMKFTERGTVTLKAGGSPLSAGRYELVISIHDTGIGIAAARMEDIFIPFVQVDSATTRRYSGTGLGLTISKQLIELMGGHISVASTPDVGSTFTLTLPLDIAATPPTVSDASPASENPHDHRRLRVLLAEDNRVNQEVLRRLLQNLGHATDVVADGAEALDAVSRKPYDVVLMDIQMPELDGEAATRGIRALEGITQPYIIALTASAIRGDRERYLAAGMDDYLSKPVQGDDLRTALGRSTTRAAPPPAPSPAQPTEPTRTIPLVDWAILDRLSIAIGGGQPQTLAVVLDLFGNTISTQMTEMAAAIATDDRPLIRLMAHKLRGGSWQLGAALLAAQWSAIEAAALNPEAGEPLGDILDRARHTYAETLAVFTERLAAVSPDSPQPNG